MTDTLGIGAGLASLAVFVPKIWDVVTDPVMGWLSDNTRSRWGRRRPWLLVGAILMSVSFIFLFTVPEYDETFTKFLYVLIVFTISATAYTVFAVPYLAIPAEISDDHHERTLIMSYRMGFAMAGLLIGSAFAPYLVSYFGGGTAGYSAMSVLIGALCAFAMLVAVFTTAKLPSRPEPKTKSKITEVFQPFFEDRAFRILISVYILQLLALGIFSSAIPFYVAYILFQGEALVATIFLCLLSAAIVAMPLWAAIAKLTGKKTSFGLAALVFSIGIASMHLGSESGVAATLYVKLAIMGVGLAGIQMLPFAMLTDIIQVSTVRQGQRREAGYTGLWTASEKLGLAFGPLITGLVLQVTGFKAAIAGQAQTQSEFATSGIMICVAILPAVFAGISVLVLRMYPITESVMNSMTVASTDVE